MSGRGVVSGEASCACSAHAVRMQCVCSAYAVRMQCWLSAYLAEISTAPSEKQNLFHVCSIGVCNERTKVVPLDTNTASLLLASITSKPFAVRASVSL